MLEKFINRIIALAPVEYKVKDGVEYSTRQLHKIEKPMAKSLSVNSLEGVVEFVLNTMGIGKIKYPLVLNVGHDTVHVHSQLNSNLERDCLLKADALIPNIGLGIFMTPESFIIKLQTVFQQDENRDNLLELVSDIRNEKSLEIKDNGIAQTATMTTGIALKEVVELNPIVTLSPYRTFEEVHQVATKFLFRINKEGEIALFEADGGQWKNDARRNVVKYLKGNLGILGNEELIVVIG